MLAIQQNSCRQAFALEGMFRFQTDPENVGEIHGWSASLPGPTVELAVPASWNEQRADLYNYFGVGWYELPFHLPADWNGRRIRVRFEGVNQDLRVWLDGSFLGEHLGGHLPAEFDLGPAARPGCDHKLLVRIDNRLRGDTLPPGDSRRSEDRLGFTRAYPDVPFDFLPMGGIHRQVFLYATAPVSIESVRVETGFRDGGAWVRCAVRTSDPADDHVVEAELDGEILTLAPGADGRYSGEFYLPVFRKWDIGQPELYRLQLRVRRGETTVDAYAQDFGIRTVRCTATQLLLNDRPVFLKGFGKHEDFPVIGRGLNHAVIVRDFDMMRWMHANSLRTSHYPYAREVLDYADRHGLLVISESPFVSLAERVMTPESANHAVSVLHELVERDFNHPSVVMWSVANEPFLRSEVGDFFFKTLADAVRAEDGTRPVIYVAHESPAENSPARYFDAIGVNKYFGWYEGCGRIDETLDRLPSLLSEFHKAFGIPIFLSEFGADAIAGVQSYPNTIFTEGFQTEILEKQYLAVKDLPFLFGTHVWNFADFATAQQLNRARGNRKGVLTRDRDPKMAAWKLRDLWSRQPDHLD